MLSDDIMARCVGEDILSAVSGDREEICEIRLRANRPSQIRLANGNTIEGINISGKRLEKVVSALAMGSFYAVEDQMRQGFFSVQGGIRVGVCGKMNMDAGGKYTLSSIGSVCIRIPREIKGCAGAIWESAGFSNILILSPPGLGKTTMLRDYVRIASDSGRNIAVADERREIAACMQGIPQMDIGKCSDVIDDCPKERAIPLLLRSCAPDMIAADEIAFESEARCLRVASKCGVKIAATAHAASLDDALSRKTIGKLIREGIFERVILLNGKIGRVSGIYQY